MAVKFAFADRSCKSNSADMSDSPIVVCVFNFCKQWQDSRNLQLKNMPYTVQEHVHVCLVCSSALHGQVVTSVQVRFTCSLWTFSGACVLINIYTCLARRIVTKSQTECQDSRVRTKTYRTSSYCYFLPSKASQNESQVKLC